MWKCRETDAIHWNTHQEWNLEVYQKSWGAGPPTNGRMFQVSLDLESWMESPMMTHHPRAAQASRSLGPKNDMLRTSTKTWKSIQFKSPWFSTNISKQNPFEGATQKWRWDPWRWRRPFATLFRRGTPAMHRSLRDPQTRATMKVFDDSIK